MLSEFQSIYSITSRTVELRPRLPPSLVVILGMIVASYRKTLAISFKTKNIAYLRERERMCEVRERGECVWDPAGII